MVALKSDRGAIFSGSHPMNRKAPLGFGSASDSQNETPAGEATAHTDIENALRLVYNQCRVQRWGGVILDPAAHHKLYPLNGAVV
jgi:hypothetical protein